MLIIFTLKIRRFLYKIVINYLLSPFLYAFFISVRPFFFFLLFVFSYIIMYILNIARTIKKMSVNKIRDFIFKNYYKELDFLKKTVIIQWNAWKKWFIYACKQIKRKIADPRNVKEHYQSFIRKKHTKLANQLKNKYLSTKTFENPNIVDIKSTTTEYPKLHKNYPRP